MTKVEIIKETAKFYGDDTSRRSWLKGSCQYLLPIGNMCAFSRCMIKPENAHLYEGELCSGVIAQLSGIWPSVFPLSEVVPTGILKPEYDGHTVMFWMDVQQLHDCPQYWNKNGLSMNGDWYYNQLLEKYAA